jgi:hypothetical protein
MDLIPQLVGALKGPSILWVLHSAMISFSMPSAWLIDLLAANFSDVFPVLSLELQFRHRVLVSLVSSWQPSCSW